MGALRQAEELNQALGQSRKVQLELEDQLSDARSRLGQLELVRTASVTMTMQHYTLSWRDVIMLITPLFYLASI